MTVVPLHVAVQVLEGVLSPRGVFPLKEVFPHGRVQGVKALRAVVVMGDLFHLAVSRHVVNLMIHEAHPLEILMEMYVLYILRKKLRCSLLVFASKSFNGILIHGRIFIFKMWC